MRTSDDVSRYDPIAPGMPGADILFVRENVEDLYASNMFGDIGSDIAAKVTGGVGLVSSNNTNPNNPRAVSMFETMGGTADDIAGQNKANPVALIDAAAEMLLHIGGADTNNEASSNQNRSRWGIVLAGGVGVCLALLGTEVAWARTKVPPVQATRASVDAALTKDGRPLVPADVKAMGKDAEHVLIEIVRDEHAPSGLRGRAIDALAASGSVVARDQLLRIVKPTQNEVELPLVRKALLGLGWLHDARIVANAGPWLAHDSAAVRLDAAVALALAKNIDATDLLEKHNRTEKSSDLKRGIARLVANNRAEQPHSKPAHKPRIMLPPPIESRDSHRF